MRKRILGRTGFEVSEVGFGGIPIQRIDQKKVNELFVEAHYRGVNFIDTSIRYTTSESLIGNALEKVGREHFYVATKSMNRTYKGIINEFNISLKQLKLDYIDLYQFHNPKTLEHYSEILRPNGALDAVKAMKKIGLIREIGITSHNLDVLLEAVKTDEFSTIQFPYNAIERQAEELFKIAKSKNIGVIVMKPLAGGSITKGELAIRYILENQNVSVVIPGMESIDQVIENTRPGIDGRSLTEEERNELFAEAKLLGNLFCRRCGYCTPCTAGIDIPGQFLLDGYLTRYNLVKWATDRYHKQDYKASDCIECGSCLTKCPYNLPIIDMLKTVASHY